MSEDVTPYPGRGHRGGVRKNSGRPSVGGIERTMSLHFKTTTRTWLWFHAIASTMGGYGPALESLCEKELGPEVPANDC